MTEPHSRRHFNQLLAGVGSLSLFPLDWTAVTEITADSAATPAEYDIFTKLTPPKKLLRFSFAHLRDHLLTSDPMEPWYLRALLTVFQGLVNRIEPRLYLMDSPHDPDWLSFYQEEGHTFSVTDVSDPKQLLREFASDLDGYTLIDPSFHHTINIAQTLGTLENWLPIAPEHERFVREAGLEKREDFRGRWNDRVTAYEWAFENLFDRCSKHIVGNMCVDFPIFPSTSAHIRDFLVCNSAFTSDLSAARRQRRENALLDRIYERLEFPAGVWGWHCTRDHEHWAVARASRRGVYTICAAQSANFSVHGGVRPKKEHFPVTQPVKQRNLAVGKDKIYIAFMMTDGDSLWAMANLQCGKWASQEHRSVPLSFGFLPLLPDVAPAMFSYLVRNQRPDDYLVTGPAGAGYTYTHLHPQPRNFLRYSRHYMEKCGLETVHITNWNDDTNWQEVNVPWYNDMLFEEWDHCVGYLRGMGESAFEPHCNLGDKPYVFVGEGIHRRDKDDADTLRSFIEANPNRPLFVLCLNNISVATERIEKVVENLGDYDIDYVRVDELMQLVKNAYEKGWITEDLYPNTTGNEAILRKEAPANWAATQGDIRRLLPVLEAKTREEALAEMNDEKVRLALGQKITEEDGADILAFTLCERMFSLVKNVLNLHGIYVNVKRESVNRLIQLHGDWDKVAVIRELADVWEDWDRSTNEWEATRRMGSDFIVVFDQADALFDLRHE